MNKYRFTVFDKCEIWLETDAEVEASSYEEALEKCKKHNYNMVSEKLDYQSMCFADKIKGEPSMEIYDEKWKLLYTDKDEDKKEDKNGQTSEDETEKLTAV